MQNTVSKGETVNCKIYAPFLSRLQYNFNLIINTTLFEFILK